MARAGSILIAAAIACSSGAALAGGQRFPPQLVGKWTRTVTAADVVRSKTNGVTAGSFWTLIVQKSGASIAGGNGGQFTGKLVPAGATTINVEMGDATPNVYAWHIAGRRLILTRVRDADGDRAAVFSGTWHRGT
jgi:hypothetical protein